MSAPRRIRTSSNLPPKHTPTRDCTYGYTGSLCWVCLELATRPQVSRHIYPDRRGATLSPMAKPKPSLRDRIYILATAVVGFFAFALILLAVTSQS